MSLDLIKKTVFLNIILGFLFLIGCALAEETSAGLGIFAGALWSSCNLFFLKHLLANWLKIGEREYLKIYLLVFLKFPLLYLAGFALIFWGIISPFSLLIGFSLQFFALFLNGVNVLYLKRKVAHS